MPLHRSNALARLGAKYILEKDASIGIVQLAATPQISPLLIASID
jgi:hypothetical protein